MPYGAIKVDNITFTNGGADQPTTVSGIYRAITSGVTVTGTISGATIQGATVSGTTVTGTTANFVSGVFTTQLSGVTVTGTTASFTSGVFTALSGTTTTVTSGIFGAGSAAAPSIAFSGDLNTGIYSPAADTLAFVEGGVEAMRIDSSARVGIGTSSPGTTLDVVGNSRFVFGTGATNTGDQNVIIAGLATTGAHVSSYGAALQFQITNSTGGYAGARILSRLNADNNTANLVFQARNYGFTDSMTLDSSGRLLVGTSTSVSTAALGNAQVQVVGTTNETAQLSVSRFSNDADRPRLSLIKSRGSLGTNTIVQSGDAIGRIEFLAADGSGSTAYPVAAHIGAEVDGTPGANDMPGRLVFSTTADGAASPTERMRIDSSGRVGIGTTSPGCKIDIVSENNTSLDPVLRIYSNNLAVNTAIAYDGITGSSQFQLRTSSSNPLLFGTNNTERARIDSSGRLLVGQNTNPDGYYFIVNTGSGSNNNAVQLSNNADADLRINLTSGVSLINANTGILALGTSGTERARIDSSGRLLVGTSSARNFNNGITTPRLQLEGLDVSQATFGLARNSANTGGPVISFGKSRGTVTGSMTAVIAQDDLGRIQFQGADGTQLQQAAEISAHVDGTPGANDMPGRLVFSTTADGAASPTERMVIKSNGDIRINQNTTSTPGLANTTAGIAIESTNAIFASRASGIALFLNRNNDGATTEFHQSGNVVGTISVTASATAYNTSSDYRLKENLVPLTGAIDRVNDLQVHRFNFIADPGKTVDGFIAHEAQAVVPECVTGEKDEVDGDGNPVYQGIDQSKLVPLLTAALQEAIAKIETLEARLTAAGIE